MEIVCLAVRADTIRPRNGGRPACRLSTEAPTHPAQTLLRTA